ncbi:hypothetical protein OC835_000696 [Tilletia horrida]|nr:hypothetical protein OC835_000696 [Tilletia horrida]
MARNKTHPRRSRNSRTAAAAAPLPAPAPPHPHHYFHSSASTSTFIHDDDYDHDDHHHQQNKRRRYNSNDQPYADSTADWEVSTASSSPRPPPPPPAPQSFYSRYQQPSSSSSSSPQKQQHPLRSRHLTNMGTRSTPRPSYLQDISSSASANKNEQEQRLDQAQPLLLLLDLNGTLLFRPQRSQSSKEASLRSIHRPYLRSFLLYALGIPNEHEEACARLATSDREILEHLTDWPSPALDILDPLTQATIKRKKVRKAQPKDAARRLHAIHSDFHHVKLGPIPFAQKPLIPAGKDGQREGYTQTCSPNADRDDEQGTHSWSLSEQEIKRYGRYTPLPPSTTSISISTSTTTPTTSSPPPPAIHEPRFNTIIWSSAQPGNVHAMTRTLCMPTWANHFHHQHTALLTKPIHYGIGPAQQNSVALLARIQNIWARDTLISEDAPEYKIKALCLKDLEIPWFALNTGGPSALPRRPYGKGFRRQQTTLGRALPYTNRLSAWQRRLDDEERKDLHGKDWVPELDEHGNPRLPERLLKQIELKREGKQEELEIGAASAGSDEDSEQATARDDDEEEQSEDSADDEGEAASDSASQSGRSSTSQASSSSPSSSSWIPPRARPEDDPLAHLMQQVRIGETPGQGSAAAEAHFLSQHMPLPPTSEGIPPRWSAANTLLIDDSPEKATLQPYNHICVPEFGEQAAHAANAMRERILTALSQRAAEERSGSGSGPGPASGLGSGSGSGGQDGETDKGKSKDRGGREGREMQQQQHGDDKSSSSRADPRSASPGPLPDALLTPWNQDPDLLFPPPRSRPHSSSPSGRQRLVDVLEQQEEEARRGVDTTLLQLIGVLEEARHRPHVGAWIRAGGLGGFGSRLIGLSVKIPDGGAGGGGGARGSGSAGETWRRSPERDRAHGETWRRSPERERAHGETWRRSPERDRAGAPGRQNREEEREVTMLKKTTPEEWARKGKETLRKLGIPLFF